MSHLQVGQAYLVDEDFQAETEGELSVAKGEKVEVLEAEDPNNPGWIFVQKGVQSGFVPSDFLAEDQPLSQQTPSADSYQERPSPSPPQQQQPHHSFSSQQFQPSFPLPQPVSQYAPPPPPQGSHNLQYQGYSSGTQSSQGQYQQNAYSSPPPAGIGGPPPAVGAPRPLSQIDRASADKAVAENEARFQAEQRLISIELWKYREELLGGCEAPNPPNRRWFYRDFFGDQQGPFNAEEMRERLQKQYIKDSSKVVMEIGFGEAAKFEEETLRDLFRSPDAAFVETPRLTKIGAYCWYFIGRNGEETGPFSNDQMKIWYNAGYMGGGLLVRLANGKSSMTPLKDVYPDPQDAFHAPPLLQGFDPSKFTGHRTVVLKPPPNYEKSGQPPGEHEFEKVQVTGMGDTASSVSSRSISGSSASQSSQQQGDSKKNSGTNLVYGGAFMPYNGVPSPANVKQNVYSSMLYTFLTRPLHPDAGLVQCYIRRDIDGSHINFNKYQLFVESTNTPILAAYRHHHANAHSYFDIKLNSTGKLQDSERGLTIANVDMNFGGTLFLLHNSVSGHQGNAKDMACVTYEKNRVSNKGPRKMRIAIPSVREDKAEFTEWTHESLKSSKMVQALKSVSTKDMVIMLNKPPRWNAKKKAYMLDFKGRVTRSSVKNFQLVDAIRDPEHNRVILQHGRVGVNKFTMDVQHPMSLLQAFAIALSSLHSKKSVN